MKSEEYQEIVCKALEIAKSNLAEDLSVTEIARRVNYSPPRLREIFHKVTGRAIIEHILDFKMEEAKKLLTQTDLSITETALESGFGSLEHFTRSFRKRTGLAPRQFRGKQPSVSSSIPRTGKAPIQNARTWFAQSFAGEDFSAELQLHDGSIGQKEGFMEGHGTDSAFGLTLIRPLPENVEINFDVKLLSTGNGGPSHALFSFADESMTTFWYHIVLVMQDQGSCILKQLGINSRIHPNPCLKPDQWQSLRIQLLDDRLNVFLDQQSLFAYQNDFPPLYKQRCRFRFGTYQSDAHFRNLSIKDLGIPALARSIRQGDALYNVKAYDAAREFYCRLLEMQTAQDDTPELHYKIGMCFFSQSSNSQARAWFQMAASQEGAKFWARQARLGLMRIDLLERKQTGIVKAGQYLANPDMRDEARNAMDSVGRHDVVRGDFDHNLDLKEMILKHCGFSPLLYYNALLEIAEAQEWLLRTDDCEQTLRILLSTGSPQKDLRIRALRELAYVYLMQHELALAEECLERMARESDHASDLADCDIRRAFLLRACGNTAEALALLNNVSLRKEDPYRCAEALLESSLVLCSLGEAEKARNAKEKARVKYPWFSYLQPGYVSLYAYVPEFIAGDFSCASNLLLADARMEGATVFLHGLQAMAAGFIMEIARDENGSRRIWAEVLRRFPLQRCSHYAPLAEELLKGKMPDLSRLPIGNQWLSEFHYLAALACEAKGDHAQCAKLLERCVQLDGSLRWPAHLAKNKLAG